MTDQDVLNENASLASPSAINVHKDTACSYTLAYITKL
jgi:hypothetical protein